MSWRLLASSLAGFHIAYVAFVVFGGLAVSVWPRLMPVHLACVVWAGLSMIFDLGCPVTKWEKAALRRSGREAYPEGFLQHHVLRTRFDDSRARPINIALGAAAIAINAVVYLLIL